MKIFIGSSRESLDLVRELEVWLEDNGMEPIPWDKPGLFAPGESTLSRLLEISRQVDGAVFIFAEDDRVWYRDDSTIQPRDNVILEYGFFVGALGSKRAIVIRNGNPKEASDLRGITYIDGSEARRSRARLETMIWCRSLTNEKQNVIQDAAVVQLESKVSELQRAMDSLKERLGVEVDQTSGLKRMLSEGKTVDFSQYDLNTDGHWKLLFNSDYFWSVSYAITGKFPTPRRWADELTRAGAKSIADSISWPFKDIDRTIVLVRKSLRVFQYSSRKNVWPQFVNLTRPDLSVEIVRIAKIAIEKEAQLKVDDSLQ